MAGAGNSPGSDSNLGSIPTPSRRVSAKQRAASASQPTSTTPSTPTPSAKTKANSASHAPANPSSLGAGAGSKRARVAETGSPLAKEVNYDSGECTSSLLALIIICCNPSPSPPAPKIPVSAAPNIPLSKRPETMNHTVNPRKNYFHPCRDS